MTLDPVIPREGVESQRVEVYFNYLNFRLARDPERGS